MIPTNTLFYKAWNHKCSKSLSSSNLMVFLQCHVYLHWYQLELYLTHWGRVTHICVSDLTSIGSDNGLSPGQHQAIIRTNAGILLIRPLGTNFNEILIKILIFSFKKMRLKVLSAKRRPFCLGLNELNSLNPNNQSHDFNQEVQIAIKWPLQATMEINSSVLIQTQWCQPMISRGINRSEPQFQHIEASYEKSEHKNSH